ncbi:MAG: hypothetical protein A2Y75_08575 [Candidatus Solincola sediminis]|uniref:Uncharacterized protein n=1 Tax=Candidatus Solincola sediminis TaxID=1797199 RepID=A0A1F2WMZ7_9ACTN|nr:MAG: hypothetical protein A2Y75_08575 [Candidatus Solincola sediminis]
MVFLILFTGVFSRDGAAGNHVSRARDTQAAGSGLAVINTWFPTGLDRIEPETGKTDNPEAVANLIPGDILVGRCALSPVPALNPMDAWTHTCIYVGKNKVVVAGNPKDGVSVGSVSSWMYPEMTWVAYLRVVTADDETLKKAVEFALSKDGDPYDINWFSKHAEGARWYCSELVWAAYFNASKGRIDLSRKPGVFGVSPDVIYESSNTTVIGGHYERKPDTISSMLMKAITLCVLAGGAGMLLPPSVLSVLISKR